jgi:molecular chaperone HscB
MWLWRELPRIDELPNGSQLQSDGKLKFSDNFFEIFAIPEAWVVDLNGLNIRYRALQQEFHPDKYSTKSQIDQRLAVQMTSLINQAFETLKCPLKRAQYLLELSNINTDQETHITTDGNFLMQQIELREGLQDIFNHKEPWEMLERMRREIEDIYLNLQDSFQENYQKGSLDDALNITAKMQFFSKLLIEVENVEAELEDI